MNKYDLSNYICSEEDTMSNPFASLAGHFDHEAPTTIDAGQAETTAGTTPAKTPKRKKVAAEPEKKAPLADDKKRQKLGDTFLVRLKLFRNPYDEKTPTGIEYKKYGIPLGDRKYLNFFIHGRPDARKGDVIIAEAQAWWTELPDGRQFVHVDLNPTDLGATRNIRILKDKNNLPDDLPKGTYVRSLPYPMEAAVAFVPIKN